MKLSSSNSTYAFTLAEMMVVMLVMAIILAVMAPILTRKVRPEGSASSSGASVWRFDETNTRANMRGNQNKKAIISQGADDNFADNARLIIETSATIPDHISFRRQGVTDTLGAIFFSENKGIMLGDGTVNGVDAIAIGRDGSAAQKNAIAIGSNSKANSENTMALGASASALGLTSIAIGNNSKAQANSLAIGQNANAQAQNSIAIGQNAVSTLQNTIVLGCKSSNCGSGSSPMIIVPSDKICDAESNCVSIKALSELLALPTP